ncbi:PDDEXK-like family protein [Phormidesmis sp. 146-33]
MDKADQSILEALIVDNPDLTLLESKLSSFNIFEAVGMTRQEIRHSYFLAFLLNPSESHYFGDLFLKKFLITTLLDFEDPPFSAIEIDVASLEDTEVKREYRNIDILIYSPINKIVIAIENKVDSVEHSDQLNRYREIVSTEFPDYQKCLIYLTKDGDKASESNWHSLSYETIANCIDSICLQHSAKMNGDVRSLMTHYSNLIKRHIMSDSEIANLCRKIYKQHRQALDLIYEHRPDWQSEISDFLQQLIQNNQEHDIEKDDCNKKCIRFAPKEWDELKFQKTCHGWTSSQRILLFQFWNDSQYLGLGLVAGPGDQTLKQNIYDAIRNSFPGRRQRTLKGAGWNEIFAIPILNASDYEDGDLDSVKEKIKSFFEKSLNHEIKLIRQAITQLQRNPTTE